MTTSETALGTAGLIQAEACSKFDTMFRCVSSAAFATPVVPPVDCRKAASCGVTLTGPSLSPKPDDNALLKRSEPGIFHGGTCLRTCRSTKFTIGPDRK